MQNPDVATAIFNGIALANVVSSLIVLYFMQTVTAGSGVRSGLALLQLMQRAFYIALAFALMVNAAHIYNDHVLPDLHDGSVELALCALCVISFLRHRLAPPIPASASWHREVPS